MNLENISIEELIDTAGGSGDVLVTKGMETILMMVQGKVVSLILGFLSLDFPYSNLYNLLDKNY
jgi:hypothetical protein